MIIKEAFNILNKIDAYFHITKDGSTIKTEILSGLTAYFTMVYLLFLVPNTIMTAFPEAYNSNGDIMLDSMVRYGITAGQLLTALTVLCCVSAFIGTLVLSFSTNLPFAQGPSLSICTFVAYNICNKMGYSYNEALAAILISGIAFFIMTSVGLERKIQNAIPSNLKFSVTAGIGFFIAFMGIQKAHLIEHSPTHLVQLVSLTDNSPNSKSALLCLFGIILIAILIIKHVHSAVFVGKVVCIILAIPMGLFYLAPVNMNISDAFEILFTLLTPDFTGLFSPHHTFGILGTIFSVTIIIMTLCLMDIFESMGTIFATDNIIRLSHEGTMEEKFTKVLHADAITTTIGSMLGTTNVSTYVESTAMVIEGGRTGLSGIIAGICFLLTIFIAPFAASIPSAATATTLIMSGVLMMDVIKYINFEKIEDSLPAFLTMLMIPLSYSLVTGIALGLISHTIIMICTGKSKQISKYTYITTITFIIQTILLG